MRIKPEQMPLAWMFLGYLMLFFGILVAKNTYVALGGYSLAFVGIIAQSYIARIMATPYSFLKSPVRSFFYPRTEVKQFQIVGDGVTVKGAAKTKYYNNRTVFELGAPETHPQYGSQNVLVIEHELEIKDHIKWEDGEITFYGASGVPHNKIAIADLWETPEVYTIGASISPVYIFPKGPGMIDYRKWVDAEFSNMDSRKVRELRTIVQRLVVAE